MNCAEVCPVKLEKMLLSTDGSEFSEGAIREAISLAKKCSSKLFVLYVIEVNEEFSALAPQLVENKEIEAREHLESLKARAAKEGVECEVLVHEGEEPFRFIVDEAARKQVEIIVMGRRGKTGLKRLMMGSVTAKVIGHSPCKVLVVPRAAKTEFKNILVATDGSKYSHSAVLEAIGLAKRCAADLTVLSVVPSETASAFDIVHSAMQKDLIIEKELKMAECSVKEAGETAGKEGVKAQGLVISGRPYEAILETAKEKKADLIIVGSHGRTGLEKLIMGSVTERVIVLASCTVLVVKA